MTESQKQIIIPKEKAVFWMDKNGVWYNVHGKFEHPRIIKYFNASIRKDENGYHVYQIRDGCEEKVYFNYEDTAVFVVDVIEGDHPVLVLNTTEKIPLDPEQMVVKDDSLYVKTPDHLIKFNDRALLKISGLITETDEGLFISLADRSVKIGDSAGTST
jgi:hypothetical protein